ncbi:MAG: HD domain-containing protein, partial [Deltaproteobacteria bacterium]|nr:HD domain-containing protein [Deltaproteobacteria bacterium]
MTTLNQDIYLQEYQWFKQYSGSFLIKNQAPDSLENHDSLTQADLLYNENISLKIVHSKNVAKNMLSLASSINLNPEKSILAAIIGLYHDIGRFKQYRDYKTFCDDASVYHGDLGIKVLKETKRLSQYSAEHRDIILTAVHNHGLAEIEKNITRDQKLFCTLIRDADKMDIFRIVNAYYKKMLKGKRNISIELGLSTEDKVSQKVIDAFFKEQIILKNDLKTLNDFKILQTAWIYDLNFDYTRKFVLNSGYINSII